MTWRNDDETDRARIDTCIHDGLPSDSVTFTLASKTSSTDPASRRKQKLLETPVQRRHGSSSSLGVFTLRSFKLPPPPLTSLHCVLFGPTILRTGLCFRGALKTNGRSDCRQRASGPYSSKASLRNSRTLVRRRHCTSSCNASLSRSLACRLKSYDDNLASSTPPSRR